MWTSHAAQQDASYDANAVFNQKPSIRTWNGYYSLYSEPAKRSLYIRRTSWRKRLESFLLSASILGLISVCVYVVISELYL